MLPYLREHHADPGRLHAEGHVTRVAIENAREQVAARFGARAREVVFMASGTEAVNTAVWGALGRVGGEGHVVTTAVEHSAVLDAVRRGATETTVVGVDRVGRFDPDEVAAAMRSDTALVSVQLANHEVGTIQPAAAVVAAARARDIVVHVDACAAAGHVGVDFAALGADLCSVTGHKFGGPTGAAALLVRRGLRFPPFVVGGAQERARRGGIENVPAIVGFGAAALEAGHDEARERALTDRLASETVARVAGVERYGDPVDALPHLGCFGIEDVEAEPILLALDQRGVAVHSGSSCSSETLEPSPVLEAMGVEADRSLRVSVGWSSTDADVDAFLDAFPTVVGLLRGLRR
ncbi:MAG: cysteine desulfurase [Actinomycetota bacterium]|nr:cysteine desulfurase [Actinomycetota bacterium]